MIDSSNTTTKGYIVDGKFVESETMLIRGIHAILHKDAELLIAEMIMRRGEESLVDPRSILPIKFGAIISDPSDSVFAVYVGSNASTGKIIRMDKPDEWYDDPNGRVVYTLTNQSIFDFYEAEYLITLGAELND